MPGVVRKKSEASWKSPELGHSLPSDCGPMAARLPFWTAASHSQATKRLCETLSNATEQTQTVEILKRALAEFKDDPSAPLKERVRQVFDHHDVHSYHSTRIVILELADATFINNSSSADYTKRITYDNCSFTIQILGHDEIDLDSVSPETALALMKHLQVYDTSIEEFFTFIFNALDHTEFEVIPDYDDDPNLPLWDSRHKLVPRPQADPQDKQKE